MARLIIHRARGPVPVKDRRGVTVAAICMCGLSKKYPFCDGSHLKTRDEEEGKLYIYDEEGNRVGEVGEEELKKLLGAERLRSV
ncbi:hypothetical protein CF15_08410 [Pyrodictium occultum]|uniref:Iron-binding zinc finger CDGSH type domain-containing protein n=1 Tax=Pyrodictium occultum TaxID=2309 RepID=A0A0V8RS37_PYROC|nr:CDGSH iron-sulfur domain-containing protein [Pyrodictium occultum]KSW10787.1 hypothetical protein CF15_08410 [Pyrodictium occultum]